MNQKVLYITRLEKQFARFGIWPPGTLQLGDVVDSKTFERIGNINDKTFNIQFEPEVRLEDHSQTREWSTEGTKTIAGGANSEIAKSEIAMRFGNKNGIYFSTQGCVITAIKNQDLLGKALIKLYEKGKWSMDYYVVTELECADKVIIIVTNDKDAEVVFHVDANMPAKAKLVEANFKIGSCSCVSHSIASDKPNTSVLFLGKKIRRSAFGLGATSFRGEYYGNTIAKNSQYDFCDIEPEDFDYYGENNPE